MAKMLRLLGLVAVLTPLGCGGGGGGGSCVLIPDYDNGFSGESARSAWRCSTPQAGVFFYQFFRSGGGRIIAPDGSSCGFLWNEPDCGQLDTTLCTGDALPLRDIRGGRESGSLEFRLPGGQVDCTLFQ